MINDFLYFYEVDCTAVYDGDTITGDILLGFGSVTQGQKFRLYGIDTPEVRGEERERGLISRDWLRDKILGERIWIRSYRDKKGKYGRWLAEVFLMQDGELVNLNLEMVNLGLAEEKFY